MGAAYMVRRGIRNNTIHRGHEPGKGNRQDAGARSVGLPCQRLVFRRNAERILDVSTDRKTADDGAARRNRRGIWKTRPGHARTARHLQRWLSEGRGNPGLSMLIRGIAAPLR